MESGRLVLEDGGLLAGGAVDDTTAGSVFVENVDGSRPTDDGIVAPGSGKELGDDG